MLDKVQTVIFGNYGDPPSKANLVARVIMKAIKEELPWRVTTIGPSRSMPEGTQIRFLLEEEYQALSQEDQKEVHLRSPRVGPRVGTGGQPGDR